MKKRSVWRLVEDRAHLILGKLEATVRTAQPGLGLHDIRVNGNPVLGARCLAQRLPELAQPESRIFGDCIVRGDDLIITYPQTEARPFRLQVYWRAVAVKNLPGCLAAVDLQVSVQTTRSKVAPALVIDSLLPIQKVSRVAVTVNAKDALLGDSAADKLQTDCWSVDFSRMKFQYAEMIHPADVARTDQASVDGNATRITHNLFPQPLEKGVILRARARALFIDVTRGATSVGAAYGKFVAAPLPLTA